MSAFILLTVYLHCRELGCPTKPYDTIGSSTSNQLDHIKKQHFDKWFDAEKLPSLEGKPKEEVDTAREAAQATTGTSKFSRQLDIQTSITTFSQVSSSFVLNSSF